MRDGREDDDHDGLRTTFEFLARTSPRRLDTDSNGKDDGAENPDGDGLNNRYEQLLGTNPRVADTDGDGWTDGAEYRAGTDPRRAASHPARHAATPPPAPKPSSSCPIFPATNVWNAPIDGRPWPRTRRR